MLVTSVLEFHPTVAVYFYCIVTDLYTEFFFFVLWIFVFVDFPFISYGWSFLTEDHKFDYLFFTTT